MIYPQTYTNHMHTFTIRSQSESGTIIKISSYKAHNEWIYQVSSQADQQFMQKWQETSKHDSYWLAENGLCCWSITVMLVGVNFQQPVARPYDEWEFSPLAFTAGWLSHLALAIYMFVVVNFDALAPASDIRIERRQVVFLCWIQDSNLEVSDTYSPADWMPSHKPSELLRIKQKLEQQPVPSWFLLSGREWALLLVHYSDITSASLSWWLKSPAFFLFVQQLVQVNNNENIKAPHY